MGTPPFLRSGRSPGCSFSRFKRKYKVKLVEKRAFREIQ